MRNAGLEEAQAGIKIVGRNINNFRYADDTTLMAESEELKSLLRKVKEDRGKSWLKIQHSKNENHSIWSHHFMENRWGNNGIKIAGRNINNLRHSDDTTLIEERVGELESPDEGQRGK